MKREDLIYLLKIVVYVALIVVAFKFFIKILPLILLIIIGLLIYDSYRKYRDEKKSNKKIDNNVMDAEIIEERKDE